MGASFGEPLALIALVVIPAIIWLYYLYLRKKKQSALRFSSVSSLKPKLKNRNYRQHIPFILICIAIFFLIIGLAKPKIPLKTAKQGVNVVLAIDDSGSMSLSDYKPTRLGAAKNAAKILIDSLKPHDNVGIVVFQSGATTAAYLTPYKDRAIQKLMAIKQSNGATAIGDGLSTAVDMATSIPNKKKVIILMSDGDSNAGVVSPTQAAQFAKDNKIPVYTIGLGSTNPQLLGYNFFGQPQYATLNEAALKKIAAITGGQYYKSVNTQTLDNIYKNIGNNIKRDWEPTNIEDWFIIAALIILIADAYVIYGRYRIVV